MAASFRTALFSVLGATARMGAVRERGLRRVPQRAAAVLREGLWGFLAGALSADEKSRLGVALYDASTEYRASPKYDWEDAWLARALPAARDEQGRATHALVGGAGAGREVVALLARGHQVTALEPSEDLAARCRENTGGKARLVTLRYEDLLDAKSPLKEGEFDAVLLGLGSLSHVLDEADRVRLLEALVRLCPRGPILFSVPAPTRAEPVRRVGRAAKLGRAAALPLRRARGLPALDPLEIVFNGLGFVKLFVRPELTALGDAVGRRTSFDDGAPDGMELCVLEEAAPRK